MVTHKDFNKEVVAESTVARTLVREDTGKFIRSSNGSATTFTIAPDSSGRWSDGSELSIMQGGAGQITVAAGSGVTLRAVPTAKTRVQYSVIQAKRIAANEWVLYGDLAAS